MVLCDFLWVNKKREARSYLGNNIEYEIQYFDKLERTKSAKLKFVISQIN